MAYFLAEAGLLQEHAEGARRGRIAMVRIRIGGQEIMLYDSPPMHDFTFTRATCTFITCDGEPQLRRMAEALFQGGAVLMPVDDYGFSALVTWVVDRFGVSGQLKLE